MRTLLIDNYDSFTYNLFHYLAEVSGHEPVVLRNDDPAWHPGLLEDFDNVVLSPGPGHPGVPADFGICREVLETADLPVLGICLGHQGMALLHGATVDRAPEPRHGRISAVEHTGEGLFAGLPSPFDVVRYHSLAVTDLPPELTATAWTADGVLMGFQHTERPLWGLQFHPESVLTRHGHDLLANFLRLSGDWHARRGARPAGGRTTAPAPGTGLLPDPVDGPPSRKLRVLAEHLVTDWPEEAAYQHLFGGSGHAFWLDGSRPDDDAGRFSVMGDASGPLARIAEADVTSGTVTVRSAAGREVVSGPFLDWLDRDLRSLYTELPDLPGPFALGWVGYLGYELKAECGGSAAHRSEDPDATLVFADRALVFDHLTGTTTLLALAEDGDERAARRWLTGTAATLRGRAPGTGTGADEDCGTGTGADARTGGGTAPVPRPREGADAPAGRITGELRLRHDHDAYLRLIADCHREIAAGETYEVCLTNMIEAAGDLDPWAGYRFLRRLSPAPYGALLRFGDLSVLSTSPERFLRIGADGRAESKPIKGTRPRGATPDQDAALVADLLTNEKDRAENLMIVDLVRNDLGRDAVIGSVDASEIFRVESYATVHQLVSTVRARLRPDRSAVRCVRSAFPPGSMTGAPKIRTMQIIDTLEAGPRGVYSGVIGYFSLSGAADLSVAIRTAVITPGRVRYGVGGAIVALSDPEEEYEETAVKSAPLLALTATAFPDRRAGG